MPKFIFIREEEPSPFSHNSKSTTEFEAYTVEDILYHFEGFLRGAGFSIEGRIDVVDDNTAAPPLVISSSTTDSTFTTMASDHLSSFSTDTISFSFLDTK